MKKTKRILCVALAALMLFGLGAPTVSAAPLAQRAELELATVELLDMDWPFTDVGPNDAIFEAVAFMYSFELMLGTSETTFSPNRNLTRGMVTTILWRIARDFSLDEIDPVPFSPIFSDVRDGRWYTEAVMWASEWDIVEGVGGGRFAPTNDITREQLAVMIHRFEQLFWVDGDVSVPGNAPQAPSGTSSWAQEAMRWATFHGFTNTSNPRSPASRGETAEFVYRYMLEYFFNID